MIIEKYSFQICQKLVVLSKNKTKALLCQRKGEVDMDGIFTFIGGKMETSDKNIVDGLKREKDEELGENFKVFLYPTFSWNTMYRKKDGNFMTLPHYLGIHTEGGITLNEEYSQYQWVGLDRLKDFEPKVANIPETVKKLLRLEKISEKSEYVLI